MTGPPLIYTSKMVKVRTFVWTSEAWGWSCGRLKVMAMGAKPDGRTVWGLFLDGKPICRSYGYHTAKEAMAAASSHWAVRKLVKEMEETK